MPQYYADAPLSRVRVRICHHVRPRGLSILDAQEDWRDMALPAHPLYGAGQRVHPQHGDIYSDV